MVRVLAALSTVMALAPGVLADTAGGAPAVPAPAAATAEAAVILSPVTSRRIGERRWLDVFQVGAPSTTFGLTWRALGWGSETVLLDGRPLQTGRDYTVDYTAGTLHVRRALPAGGVVEVAYALQTYLSEPKRALTVPAAQTPSNPDASESGKPRVEGLRPLLAGSLGNGKRAPAVPVSASKPEGTLRTQLLSGIRQTEVQDLLQDEANRSGRVSYLRTDPLHPQPGADTREEFTADVDVRPSSSSRLRFNNYFARESLFAESYEETERRRLQFEQTWGKSAVSLLWDRRRSDGLGVASSLDAFAISLTHPISRNLAAEGLLSFEHSLFQGWQSRSLFTLRQDLGRYVDAQASFHHSTSEFGGQTLETGASLFLQPGASAEAILGLRQSVSSRYGRYQLATADINVQLSERLQLTSELSQRQSDRYGAIFTAGVGLAARPSARTLLEAALSESTGELLGRERSHTLRVMMDPSAALKVQLGYDLLTSSHDGASQNALWAVTIGGERYVKLEGYSGLYTPAEESAYADALYRVEVRPLSALALSGHLRRVGTTADLQSLAGVGASVRLVRGVDVSATYRQPTNLDPAAPVVSGRDLQLSVAPVSGFRVFGNYSERPEDERGALLEQTHRSLGIETRLGSFSIIGSLTDIEGGITQEPGRRTDLLASLALGRSTRLYGGVRTDDVSPLDSISRRVYRVGVSQAAGDSFFLTLEGQLGWVDDAAGGRSRDPADTRAQARLGLKF